MEGDWISEAMAVRAPTDLDTGTNDTFDVLLFDATTTHQAHALPQRWRNGPRYVNIRVLAAGSVWIAFSKRSAAEVDRAVAATAAGATAKVGVKLTFGDPPFPCMIPPWASGDTMYFVREGDVTTTVEVLLSGHNPRNFLATAPLV